MRGTSRRSLKNASLWLLDPGSLICAYGTTILTNREPSELVGEHIVLCVLHGIIHEDPHNYYTHTRTNKMHMLVGCTS